MSKGKKIGMYLFLIIFSLLSIFPLIALLLSLVMIQIEKELPKEMRPK